jgi:hypothetical protein
LAKNFEIIPLAAKELNFSPASLSFHIKPLTSTTFATKFGKIE